MENMNTRELKPEEMDQVSGGVNRLVNTGTGDNAAVRMDASKGSRQIASLPNGTVVDTISDELVYDPAAGRHFVQISFTDKYGNRKIGWIASSIVGMKR